MQRKLNKKQIVPKVVAGGQAIPLGNNYFYMSGRKHEQGGIDIGENPKIGLEVEDGEVIKTSAHDLKVFSSVPFLGGHSPAELILKGNDSNKVFKAQEDFKKRNKLNNDGTKKANIGKKIPFEKWYETIPKEINDTTNYNLRLAYDKLPIKDLEAWRTGTAHLPSVLELDNGDYQFLKSKNHNTFNKEIEWYNSKDASKFRENYELDMSSEYPKYVRKNKYFIGGDIIKAIKRFVRTGSFKEDDKNVNSTNNTDDTKIRLQKNMKAAKALNLTNKNSVNYKRVRDNDSPTKTESENIENDIYARHQQFNAIAKSKGHDSQPYEIGWDNDNVLTIPGVGRVSRSTVDSIYVNAAKTPVTFADAMGLGSIETKLGATPNISTKAWYDDFIKTNGRKPTDEEVRNFERSVLNTSYHRNFGVIRPEYIFNDHEWWKRGWEESPIYKKALGDIESPIMHALMMYNLGIYNTGSKIHTDEVKKEGARIMNTPIMKKYMEDLKTRKFKCGGKIKNKAALGDWLDIGAGLVDVLGNVGSYASNIGYLKQQENYINRLKGPEQPVPLRGVKLKTNINIAPQLDAIRESVARYEKDVDNNTSSSQVGLARKQKNRIDATLQKNQLYNQKENLETELINKDKLNAQQVSGFNTQQYNQYLREKNNVENQKLLALANLSDKKSEALTGMLEGFSDSLSGIARGINQRDVERLNLKYLASKDTNGDKILKDLKSPKDEWIENYKAKQKIKKANRQVNRQDKKRQKLYDEAIARIEKEIFGEFGL